MANNDDISDEDFDRLWEEAFREATGNQFVEPRSDPSEQTKARRMRHSTEGGGARRRNILLPPRQHVPSNQQGLKVSGAGSSVSVASQSSVPQQNVGGQSNPTRIRRARRVSLSNVHDKVPRYPNQFSPTQAGEPILPVTNPPVIDQSRKNNPQDGASIVSSFTALDVSSSDQETSGWDSESRPYSRKKEPLPDRQVALKTSNSTRSTKVDTQSEAAKFVLELEPSSSEGEGGDEHPHSSAHPYTLPTTFKVIAYKESRKNPSGLLLSLNQRNEYGSVMVKDITSQSIFSNTALHRGHEILTINGHRVKSPQQAAKIMKSIKGSVELLVSAGRRPPGTRYVRVKANSKSKGNEGLGLQLQTRKGLVQAAHIDSDGLFANSSIHPGDIMLTVNGVVARDESQAMESLFESRKQDLIYTLVYSMLDLRVGLVGQLLLHPWEKSWSEDYREVTVSRCIDVDGYDRQNISIVLEFQHDWTCQCTDPFRDLQRNFGERDAWDIIIKSDIDPLLDKINKALQLAVAKLREVTGEALAAVAALDSNHTEKSPKVSPSKERIMLEP